MASKLKNFNETLSEALDEFIENGFTDAEQLAYWEKRIREAAERALTPRSQMEDIVKRAMIDAFQRDVDRGGVMKRHPGVSTFTINNVKPRLRQELSKRIAASTGLIDIDRRYIVDKTAGIFSGWASSVPAGGSRIQDKQKQKESIRKGIAGLQFKERRVVIDQVHKLSAAINDVIAKDGGAIAVQWRSHYHQAGYDYREKHKEREIESRKLPYLIRDSWAVEQGLIKLAGSKYFDTMTQPGEEVFCRCYVIYVYNIGALPVEMLTVKGKAKLDEARRMMARA